MKNYFITILALFAICNFNAQENEDSEFAGENFSLEGAIAMFKIATSVEEFEKLINEEGNNVNNLDLNDDGQIDYITVEDSVEDNKHVLVLSAIVNTEEKQDIATLVIEKNGADEAFLQIFGDSDLYAENTIAEPFEVNEQTTQGKGPNIFEVNPTRVVVNVWGWPCVRYVYAPGYRVWISPVRWAVYPRWWKPWKPFRHVVFLGHCKKHKVFVHRTASRRIVVRSYNARRHTSTTIVRGRKGKTIIHKGRAGKVRAVRVPRR